jgi:cytidine deaminase
MTLLSASERRTLLDSALAAQQCAYAVYSQFPVGAAILDAHGRLFAGANVENASYGLAICAERVAASLAVTAQPSAGQKPSAQITTDPFPWRAIAVASRGGVTPCGACRQFLIEFAPDMEVFLIDSTNHAVRQLSTLRELLPAAFESNTHLRKG